MPFRDCIGHQQSIALLQAAVTNERLAHAYLFHGEEAIGKRLTAIRLAQALNCEQPPEADGLDSCGACRSCQQIEARTHPDFFVIEPDPESDHDGPARVLRCVALARGAALAAIRLGREGGADPVAHCGFRGEGRLVVAGIAADNPMLSGYVDRGHRDRVQVEDLERELPDDVVQVMFAGPLPAMLDLYPRLVAGLGAQARVERTLYPGHEMGFLDVLHPQVSKGNALEFLRERWGLAREETMAIGDNWNDREMLTVAGRGLVMGNADPALHALGLEVLPTNDEDGVAVAIERYVLGGD